MCTTTAQIRKAIVCIIVWSNILKHLTQPKVFYFIFFWFLRTGFFCSFGGCPGTSSCRSCWPQTHRDPPASASRVLGLKAYTTTTQRISFLKKYTYYFIDIYNYALQACLKLHNLGYEVLNNQKDITEFLELIDNIALKNIPQLLK